MVKISIKRNDYIYRLLKFLFLTLNQNNLFLIVKREIRYLNLKLNITKFTKKDSYYI